MKNRFQQFYLSILLAIAFVSYIIQNYYPPIKVISYFCYFFITINYFPNFRTLTKQNFIFFILAFYFFFLTISGILRGNYFNYVLFDTIIYSSVVFLTFFNSNINSNNIPILFARLLPISLIFAFSTIFLFSDFTSLATRSLTSDNNSMADDSWIVGPLIIAPFLVPFISKMRNHLKIIVLVANITLLLFGILTATRSYILITILALLSLINFQKLFKFKFLFITSLFILSLFFISLTETYTNSIFADQINLVTARFNSDGDFSNGRNSEVDGLFKEFNFFNFAFGKGAGAEQKFGFWENIIGNGHGVNFTHFGFLNLILKGGVVLLILVYGTAIYSLFVLLKHREKEYIFVILIYLTAELSHTLFINYFAVLFLWIACSRALNIKSRKNVPLF